MSSVSAKSKSSHSKSKTTANTKYNVLLIGNPGVGKSTLLNGLIGEVKFKSGFSLGTGMTTVLQKSEETADGITYVDTPGLNDAETQQRAASEIEKALKLGGNYRIAFVITLESGRVRTSDLAMMKIVTEAVSVKFPFVLIVNKLSAAAMEKQQETTEYATQYITTHCKRPPSHVLLLKQDAELDDKSNALASQHVCDAIRKVIAKLDVVAIHDTDVEPLKVNELEDMMQKMQAENEALRKTFEAERQAQEAEYKRRFDAMDEKQKKLETELRESQRRETASIVSIPAGYSFGDQGQGPSGLCGKPTSSTGKPCRNTANCPWH